jgi:hypothetical protein
LAKIKKTRIIIVILIVFIIALIAIKLMLPPLAKDYVNKVINNINGYSGSVSDIDINLWRGAYTLHNIKIDKKESGIPVPFIDIPEMDLSVQWRALLHGAVVAVINFRDPVVNFAIGKDGKVKQTGVEANWTDPLNKLVPIDINLVTVSNGMITYKDFSKDPNVNIFIKDISLEARNLQSVEDKKNLLPSSFSLTGSSIGAGALAIDGHANILKTPPDFDLNGKLEKVNLPALNDYSRAYAFIDFDRGSLNIYTEFAVRDGRLSGYIKPLATDVSFVNLEKDDNPVKLVWETIVATFATIFKNQPTDQLATRIPLQGDVSNPGISIWPTIAGIFRNAFIEAYKNNIDNSLSSPEAPQ